MTDAASPSGLAQLLQLLQGGGQNQQYSVDQMMPGRAYGPPAQSMQSMPPGLPPNIMALWAAMTPLARAQYMAATQKSLGGPQMASLSPQQPGSAPTNLSLSPAMLAQFANLQPQVQYGDPMAMRPNNDVMTRLTGAQQMMNSGTGP